MTIINDIASGSKNWIKKRLRTPIAKSLEWTQKRNQLVEQLRNEGNFLPIEEKLKLLKRKFKLDSRLYPENELVKRFKRDLKNLRNLQDG